MGEPTAKDIILRPIDAQTANALVRRVHYSGKVVNNSQLHIGVYLGGKLEGAMQFGPSLDKRKIQGLVTGTGWNEFIELNRMAFTDRLPRNSESRALSIAMRLLRKHAPHVKWVITFADGTQCGDGTIYRAAGFVLTGVKENITLVELPDGFRFADKTLNGQGSQGGEAVRREAKRRMSALGVTIRETGAASISQYIAGGARRLPGFQLRYLYFIDPTCRERLTVPILPFSEIERRGAGMYRGVPRAESIVADAPTIHAGEDGSHPISALHGEAD